MSEFTNDNLRWIIQSGSRTEARLASELLEARRPAEEPYPPKRVGPRCGHAQKPAPGGHPWVALFPCPYPDCPEGTLAKRYHHRVPRTGPIMSERDLYNGKGEELVYESLQYRFTHDDAKGKGYDFDGYAWELVT